MKSLGPTLQLVTTVSYKSKMLNYRLDIKINDESIHLKALGAQLLYGNVNKFNVNLTTHRQLEFGFIIEL